MEKLTQPKLKQSEASQLQANMAIELIAAFRLIEEEVNELVEKAGKENWTVDKLETELQKIN
jgi:hypothetical protein